MKSCPEREEQLFLELHGELAAETREDWHAHLKSCGRCRNELRRMQTLQTRIKRDLTEPTLSPGESDAMAAAIFGKVLEPSPRRSWFKPLRPAFVAGFATACILGLSAFVYNAYFKPGPQSAATGTLSADRGAPSTTSDDMEIIQNLDILKNFNTIEKLIRVVDNGGGKRIPQGGNHNSDDQRVRSQQDVSYV